jgi:hypothetical protein
MLYENGVMLGLAHSINDHISRYGKGRFCHWGSDLYFSSSDGSDANGRPRALFDRVLAAYAAEGFPPDIVGQWAIPAQDGIDLITLVRERQPKSVLEVGTFVGISTMLIALAGGRTTRIVVYARSYPANRSASPC